MKLRLKIKNIKLRSRNKDSNSKTLKRTPEEHKRTGAMYDRNFYEVAGLVDGVWEVTVKNA